MSGEETGASSLTGDAAGSRTYREDPGFMVWAAAAAAELAYLGDVEAESLECSGGSECGAGRESGCGDSSPCAGEALAFLLSGSVLGDPGGRRVPGYYARAADRRLAAANLLYALYGNAWRDIDGRDCNLRLYTDCDPEEDLGTVIGLDATRRTDCPAGTVIFLLDPVDLGCFVCSGEADLYRLYGAVSAGSFPYSSAK